MKKTAIILVIFFLILVLGSIYVVWDIFKDVFLLAK
jgi:hypothetical protein